MLKDKNIILTGAGRGIGRGLALRLASEGANLVLVARTESELRGTYEILTNINENAFFLCIDISDEEEVLKGFAEIINRMVRIDCLINNAGIQPPIGQFHKTKLFEWKRNCFVNLFGTVNCTYAVINQMISQKKGKIINFSGGGSTSARPNFSAYGVSKTAILRFTETIAEELKEYKIDVNAVAPGAINTKMLDEVIAAEESAGNEYFDALKRKSDGGNSQEFVNDLVCFLASEKSDGITGKLISAPWDPWQNEEFQNLLRIDKDFATLRRIDNKTFFKKT